MWDEMRWSCAHWCTAAAEEAECGLTSLASFRVKGTTTMCHCLWFFLPHFHLFLKNLGCQSYPPNWDLGVIFIATFHFWTHPFIHYHFLCDVPLFVVILSLVIFSYSKSFLQLRDRNQWFLFPQMCPRIRTKICIQNCYELLTAFLNSALWKT